MNQYPAQTIRLRTIRCRRVHLRGPDSDSAVAVDAWAASGTKLFYGRSWVLGLGRAHLNLCTSDRKARTCNWELRPKTQDLTPKTCSVFQIRIDPALNLQPPLVVRIEADTQRLRLAPTDRSPDNHPRQSHQGERDLYIRTVGKIFCAGKRHASGTHLDAAGDAAAAVAD